MKFILFFLTLLFAFSAYTQPPENTNSSTNYSNQEPIEESEILRIVPSIGMDSVSMKIKSESNRDYKNVTPKRSKESKGYSSAHKMQSKQLLETESKKVKYQSNSRSPSVKSQQIMDVEVEKLKEIDDQSFEYHFYNYVSGNYDEKRQESLYKAQSIDAENQEVQKLMVANSLVQGDLKSAKNNLIILANNGVLSKETIAYTEDVLISAGDNELLLTHGTNDSYGAIYNQQIQGNKFSSIHVVSLELMKSDSYRESMRSKGIEVPNRKSVDVQFFVELCRLNSNKGISISMTFPIAYLKPLADQLIPYGLVLKTGLQKKLCASDLEDLWNHQLNKKNLTKFNSAESKNYARNYRPTEKILNDYYNSKQSNYYMKSIGVQKTKKKKPR